MCKMCFFFLIVIVLIFSQSKGAEADFASECLQAHNYYRKLHGVPPLQLSSELNSVAQKWANYLARTNTFQHSRSNYGENLYMSRNLKVDANRAVKSWYSEILHYKPSKPDSNWTTTGHFTQLVWRNSKRLGCALARKGNNYYVVANYDPAGNWVGQYHENVLPPKKS